MLARALLRMICSMLLLLHMLPFTARYSLARVLVVMVAASSSSWPCRKHSCFVSQGRSKCMLRAVCSALAAQHAVLYCCQVLAGQGLGGHGSCVQQWWPLQKALSCSEVISRQEMQQLVMIVVLSVLASPHAAPLCTSLPRVLVTISNDWPCRKQSTFVSKRCSKYIVRALVL